MLCKIADLMVEIPATGGMASRCREYLTEENVSADIVIRAERYKTERWVNLTEDQAIYMESGNQFYRSLLNYDGLMLHASAVELDGKAYLFSGPCGMGKSTHTRLWKEIFGDKANVFNDDKPALRRIDDTWFAYGTPWCGKDGININMKVPLAGICFLKRGEKNIIRQLSQTEAAFSIISQTVRKFKLSEDLDKMLKLAESVAGRIPVYELYNRPEPEAARLSYETMRQGAKEALL